MGNDILSGRYSNDQVMKQLNDIDTIIFGAATWIGTGEMTAREGADFLSTFSSVDSERMGVFGICQ